MYYSMFKDLRKRIATEFGITLNEDGSIASATGSVKDIAWFNNQYEGIIHTTPLILIDFKPLAFTKATKEARRTPIGISLHVVSEVISASDKDVEDAQTIEHEDIAGRLIETVDGKQIDFNGEYLITQPLNMTGYTHYHNYKGFMVTIIDFETKG